MLTSNSLKKHLYMVNSAKKDLKRRVEFYKNVCRLQFFKYIIRNQNIPTTIRVRFKTLLVVESNKALMLSPEGSAKVGSRGAKRIGGNEAPKSLIFSALLPIGVKTKIRNRCIITGRGRGVFRFCKLSRGPLQEKALGGYLNGLSKSSW